MIFLLMFVRILLCSLLVSQVSHKIAHICVICDNLRSLFSLVILTTLKRWLRIIFDVESRAVAFDISVISVYHASS